MTRLEECNTKVECVRAELKARGFDAVVIKKQANFSWITSGGRGFIGLASENACGSIVVSLDGVYLAANNIESVRLFAEELPEKFAQPLTLNWTVDGDMDSILQKNFGHITNDTQMDNWFKKKRTILNENEILRYRELGTATAEVLENICLSIHPGMTEFEVAGEISKGLWSRGIEPITLLVAADERSEHVRHYVPTNGQIHSGVIASLCARSDGLIVSATRGVAFQKDFAQNYKKLLEVEQAAFEATKGGATLGDVVKTIMAAYEQNRLMDEWKNHHQGGMTGYLAREYRADPASQIPVQANQAYAWNPSALGAKCEDTAILTADGLEIITPVSARWPKLQQGKWTRPDILKVY